MVSQLVQRLERDARFASDVSHELRSPLTTLATTASVLQQHREDLTSAGRESLDLLVADLSIFQSLVEDLLGDGAQRRRRRALVMETLPVDRTRPAVGAFGVAPPRTRRTARRGRRVASAIPWCAWTDAASNASSPTSSTTRIVTRAAPWRFASTSRATIVEVNVDDAGAGVPAEESEQVFERFFRGLAAHDRGIARGTGLGLALVRDHVRAFGGTITVTRSPEGGARFQILLPLVRRASRREAASRRSAGARRSGRSRLSSCTLVPDGQDAARHLEESRALRPARQDHPGDEQRPHPLQDPAGLYRGRDRPPRAVESDRALAPGAGFGAAPTRARPDQDRVARTATPRPCREASSSSRPASGTALATSTSPRHSPS